MIINQFNKIYYFTVLDAIQSSSNICNTMKTTFDFNFISTKRINSMDTYKQNNQ